MGSTLVRRQRKMLRGWFKWIPVIAIPFSILFAHAWLNIQILRADYVLRELDRESKELQEELRSAGVVQSLQQDPEVMAARALEMVFVPPKPGQREVILYTPSDIDFSPENEELTMARREPDKTPLPPTLVAAPEHTDSVVEDLVSTPIPLSESLLVKTESEDSERPSTSVQLGVAEQAGDGITDSEPTLSSPPVVLDLPADAYLEEEDGMGTLEVL